MKERPTSGWAGPGILLAALVWALGVLVLPGCRQRTESSDQRPVEPTLVAFLGRARAAHHRADLLEDKLELEQALAELGKVTGGPMADRAVEFAEIREVLADTRARMADLESRLGRPDEALREVAAGLELATEVTYFRGHLLEIRGLVEERRGRALAERALDAFEQSMTVQAEVIRSRTEPGQNR
jgi:hypothetical protein